MTLNLARIADHLDTSIVGGETAASTLLIANQAGRQLMSMHPWIFAEGAQAFLEFRPSIPVLASNNESNEADTAYDSALGRIVDTGAFADYVFLPGDEIQIISSVLSFNLKPGFYEIKARIDDDTIELFDDIRVDQTLAPGFPVYRISLSFALLPADFGEYLYLQLTDTLTRTLHRTTMADIGDRRSRGVNIDDIDFWFALNSTQPGQGGQPIPRFEFYPEPRVHDVEAARLMYRRSWVNLKGDNDELRIPDVLEPLYLELLQAYALGYEEGDRGTVSQRLREIMLGPVYDSARRFDARQVSFTGTMRRGHVRPSVHGSQYNARQSFAGPN